MTKPPRTDAEKAELLKALEALVAECEQEVSDQAAKKAAAGKDAVEAGPAKNAFGDAPAVPTNLTSEVKPKGRLLQLQLQDALPSKTKR